MKELYQKTFLSNREVKACKDGFIYVHDMRDRLLAMNCFSGDTEFVTNYGVMKFNECFDGQEVEVVDKDGKWRKATVRKYGKQTLNEITLQSGRTVKKIKATSNHRWILKNGAVTTDLSNTCILAKSAFCTALVYCGKAMADKMPMIKTTTNNSMSVNAFLLFNNINYLLD